jgi:hypothetical protein
LSKKASQSFAAGAAKGSQIIFSGDMCVGENTSRPANVRVVRRWRTTSALQQAAAFSKKWHGHFFDSRNA